MTGRDKAAERPARSNDPKELAQFARFAPRWWDPDGPFAPLHHLNSARLDYIRDTASRHFRLRAEALPLQSISAIDIGCGGGLVTEPLARMGATVLGIDPVPGNVRAAAAHGARMDRPPEYRVASAEEIAEEGRGFDLVTCLEVVEHVAHPDEFLETIARLVRPGGLLILSTLNRNLVSLALGKFAAEYVLRWVPRGTHDWRKFLRPAEMAAPLRRAGLQVTDVTGLNLHPLSGWQARGPIAVNYLMTATRSAAR
jgi:2-polyprenyl-6-hydroxyphenyl methylase / 3-demethylubiquinone-9 3-methyltransferase